MRSLFMKNSSKLAGIALVSLGLLAFQGSRIEQNSVAAKGGSAKIALAEGDILFQITEGGQSAAITLATGSKWTHVGMLFIQDGNWMVLEAVGPVKATSLNEWATHGKAGKYTVKRWTGGTGQLDAGSIERLRKAAQRFIGLPYDLEFRWSDDRIYCSELVWKVYKEGLGVELCDPKPMREHALGNELVQRTMKERYGSAPPLDELMISPGALYDCPLLVTVLEK